MHFSTIAISALTKLTMGRYPENSLHSQISTIMCIGSYDIPNIESLKHILTPITMLVVASAHRQWISLTSPRILYFRLSTYQSICFFCINLNIRISLKPLPILCEFDVQTVGPSVFTSDILPNDPIDSYVPSYLIVSQSQKMNFMSSSHWYDIALS